MRVNPFEKGARALTELPAPERLPSETNSLLLGPLAAKWDRVCPELVRCSTVRSNHAVTLAMHHLGGREDKPMLLFVHGILADHVTWKFVAADLASEYDVWLVDLPGCGESDSPSPSTLEPDAFSPTALGERVLQALQKCAPATDRDRETPITLVGHSLGGTVVIRTMSAPELRERYSGVLQRVDHVVLLAPCDLAVNAVPSSFLTLLGIKAWQVSLGKGLGVVEPKIRDLTKASYHLQECATLERQREYSQALTQKRHLDAAKAMLRQFVPFDPRTLRPCWSSIDPLIAEYENIHCSVLIVYGTWDETLSSAMGNKLKDEIPGSILVKVPERGHSLPTEAPLVCAELIRRFHQNLPPADLANGLNIRVYPGTIGSETRAFLGWRKQ
jgi:pimeloyl-ACP methyl ester carboxylesterase